MIFCTGWPWPRRHVSLEKHGDGRRLRPSGRSASGEPGRRPGTLGARVVLGTYGKRANLDRQLQRAFFAQRSPYLGVKYHLRLPGFPAT
ncbi:MAG: hypothetical protein WKG07_33625 [Hymenobacter sp.]